MKREMVSNSVLLTNKAHKANDASSCLMEWLHDDMIKTISAWMLGCLGSFDLLREDDREKVEDYLRFLTHAGETRFPIFACESLQKLNHFVIFMDLMLTLTLKIV